MPLLRLSSWEKISVIFIQRVLNDRPNGFGKAERFKCLCVKPASVFRQQLIECFGADTKHVCMQVKLKMTKRMFDGGERETACYV